MSAWRPDQRRPKRVSLADLGARVPARECVHCPQTMRVDQRLYETREGHPICPTCAAKTGQTVECQRCNLEGMPERLDGHSCDAFGGGGPR